jgi:hypothetical protein
MVSRRKKPFKKDCQCAKHGAEFSEISNHAGNWIALDQREDMKLDSLFAAKQARILIGCLAHNLLHIIQDAAFLDERVKPSNRLYHQTVCKGWGHVVP